MIQCSIMCAICVRLSDRALTGNVPNFTPLLRSLPLVQRQKNYIVIRKSHPIISWITQSKLNRF